MAAASTSTKKGSEDNSTVAQYNYRDHPNFFELPDDKFMKKFHFSREVMLNLCKTLEPHLSKSTKRTGVPCNLRILAAMLFFATGNYQPLIGEEIICLSQVEINRCIFEVSDAINKHLSNEWIRFPTEEEYVPIKQTFMEKFNIPGVIGIIDGTHMEISTKCVRKDLRHNYWSQMGFYAMNVSIICDSTCKILAIDAGHGGATDDDFIWRASPIREELQRRYDGGSHDSWLLGDSRYNSEEPFLMTPVKDATAGSPESKYNKAHYAAHSVVQRCITMLRARFHCLHKDSSLNYSLQRDGAIIKACAVLHNIAVAHGMHVDLYSQPEMAESDEDDEEAIAIRDEIVKNYF